MWTKDDAPSVRDDLVKGICLHLLYHFSCSPVLCSMGQIYAGSYIVQSCIYFYTGSCTSVHYLAYSLLGPEIL